MELHVLRGLLLTALAAAGCCPTTRHRFAVPLPASIEGTWTGSEHEAPLSPDQCRKLCNGLDSCWVVPYQDAARGSDPESTASTKKGDTEPRRYAVLCEFQKGNICGRRPRGLRSARRAGCDPVAHHLATAARLEAASVVAFADLERELSRFGAPQRLLASARRAARDEARHARMVTALAMRRGARPATVRIRTGPPRDLAAFAVENAREGCVRETWGALLAAWQAVHAEDDDVRDAATTIAEDELRHAALAFRVAAFALPRLDARARARVARARLVAVLELEALLDGPTEPALVRHLGLPDPRAARTLFAALRGTLLG